MLGLPAGGTARSVTAVSLMVVIYYCLKRETPGVGVSITLLDGMLHHRAGLHPLFLNNCLRPETFILEGEGISCNKHVWPRKGVVAFKFVLKGGKYLLYKPVCKKKKKPTFIS